SHTVAPSTSLVKTVGPASLAAGGVVGHSVTYTYSVTHPSPAGAYDPLSGVTLSDTDGTPTFTGGDTNSNNKLDFGETWTYTLTVTAPTQNAGTSHSNTATATGTDAGSGTATATATATITYTNVSPTITVDKVGPGTISEANTATYTFTITNTSVGTDPVTVTSVVDDKLGDLTAAAVAANGGNPI